MPERSIHVTYSMHICRGSTSLHIRHLHMRQQPPHIRRRTNASYMLYYLVLHKHCEGIERSMGGWHFYANGGLAERGGGKRCGPFPTNGS